MSHHHHDEQHCCSTAGEEHHHHCGCCCHHHHSDHDHGNFAQELIALADEAWMEVLKEKIKEEVRSSCSGLDELAKLVSDRNNKRWCAKMEEKRGSEEFKSALMAHFLEK